MTRDPARSGATGRPDLRRLDLRRAAELTALMLISSGLMALYYLRLPVLYDTDSYYHLAVARLFAAEGPVDQLPWARFSVLHDGFGDKELLFHLLLAPFAALGGGEGAGGGEVGGRIALALLGGAIVTLLVAVSRGAAGRWSYAVPAIVLLGSTDFLGRVIRLRPELLALLLVVAATVAAARRRWWLLAALAFLYTLAYTAFHALLGLALLWFLHRGVVRRRWEWRLLAIPAAAILLALLLHPHFPDNLRVWKIQSIDFFAHKGGLDVGREIRRADPAELLRANLGWLLALAVLVAASRPCDLLNEERTAQSSDDALDGIPAESARAIGDLADLLSLSAAAYLLLYLAMMRFSTYAVPLVTVATLWELRRRGRSPRRWLPLPRGRRVPTLLALTLALAVAAPASLGLLHGLANARGALDRETEWSAFGRAVPPGARVAADWGLTHVFAFFAPQGRYLNVLDPVFMWRHSPAAHAALREVMSGAEADIPAAVADDLDSDYLALSALTSPPRLRLRLAADPRLASRHAAYTLLYEIRPAGAAFLRDWRVAPGEQATVAPAEVATWTPYPRAESARRREVEGFVRLERVAGKGGATPDCATFALPLVVDVPLRRRVELSPRGDASLWLDGAALARVSDRDAILGTGSLVDLELAPGRHLLSVVSCGEGFYLLDRTED